MSIALVLSEALRQTGVTQEELAGKVGVSQSYISQICSGKRIPTLGVLERIGQCLRIPMERFTREDTCDGRAGGKMLLLNSEEMDVVMSYRAMGEIDRGLIKSLMERIASTSKMRKRLESKASAEAESGVRK